ncbi:hypothetical protein EHF33_06170 [Deinococcus psychrotolerans]|uniref:Uncharacterized protein n=1 Tax=Deinococcus psychrotolerans TaxID=2489213 RepID=A0A3G8YAI9_9DEIO|nr:hypothetical protein [Deinococcus psychrotolerans]AZI42389.1 hypothetical protein EHF33_06170 [Deinococcus psychrotolerans]
MPHSPDLSPALQSLLSYFRPLALYSHGWPAGESLLSPSVNLLGANALYAADDLDEVTLSAARTWASEYGVPALRAVRGDSGEAGHLRVGTFQVLPVPSAIQVEQTSRLHLPRWAAVLAEAHGQPEWATPISRHLAARLESSPEAVLLLAYAGSEAVGALLWQAGAAHLWGTLDEAVDAPLLSAAAELSGGEVVVSLPDSSPLTVYGGQAVSFVHLDWPHDL